AAGLEAIEGATARQREALEMLAGAPEGISTAELASRDVPPDLVSRLVRRGCISLRQDRVDRDPFVGAPQTVPSEPSAKPRALTEEQETALRRLQALSASGRFSVALLHGVTGSGKTEIYLRLAAHTRETGRRSLVLVPEIALTPAIAAQFRGA